MTSRAVGISARSWPTIIQHGNALSVSHVRLIATKTSQVASTTQEQETLSWPRYLAIRKAKRRWELVSRTPFFWYIYDNCRAWSNPLSPSHLKTYYYLPEQSALPVLGPGLMVVTCATWCYFFLGTLLHQLRVLTVLLLFSGNYAS